MQTQDRVAKARAVRRRMADVKMAKELTGRGWTVVPPRDEIQERLDQRDVDSKNGR